MALEGQEELIAALRRAGGPDLEKDIGKLLYVIGDEMRVDAQISITAGSVSGKFHEASRPGEPPHNNTGVLANNIETVQTKVLEVQVSSNAPYSVPLEYGTSKMAARPFMAPAAARAEERMPGGISAVVERAFGGRAAAAARAYSDQEAKNFGGVKGSKNG